MRHSEKTKSHTFSFTQIGEHKLPGYAQKNTEIFAFSNVHGNYDLLKDALKNIGKLKKERPYRIVVNLGSMINSGPNTGKIVAQGLFSKDGPLYKQAKADRVVELMGSQEHLFSTSLGVIHPEDQKKQRMSIDHPDYEKLVNKAKKIYKRKNGEYAWRNILKEAKLSGEEKSLNKILENWLCQLKNHYASGDILYVYAGIHRLMTLHDALEQPYFYGIMGKNSKSTSTSRYKYNHWAWVDEEFTKEKNNYERLGMFVMHGHAEEKEEISLKEILQRGRYNHQSRTNLNDELKITRVFDNTLQIFMEKQD